MYDKSFQEALRETLKSIENTPRSENNPPGLPITIKTLQELYSGLRPGVHLISTPSYIEIPAFALGVIDLTHTLIYLTDCSMEDFMDVVVSNKCEIPLQDLRHNNLDKEQFKKLGEFAASFKKTEFGNSTNICCDRVATPTEIIKRMNRYDHSWGSSEIVFIDNLNSLTPIEQHELLYELRKKTYREPQAVFIGHIDYGGQALDPSLLRYCETAIKFEEIEKVNDMNRRVTKLKDRGYGRKSIELNFNVEICKFED